MTGVLAFALILLVAVLVSEKIERTVLSVSVLFLAAGIALGRAGLDVVALEIPEGELAFAMEVVLFSILFTDGMRVPLSELTSIWRLPGRTVLAGMPLMLGAMAGLAVLVLGFSWTQAFLLSAVLLPTDPAMASAIIGREGIPLPLRRLLNVESGINDGIALPLVLVFLDVLGGPDVTIWRALLNVVLGVGLGVVIAWGVVMLERIPVLAISSRFAPMTAFGIDILVLATAELLGVNLFLAGYAAGVTVASVGHEIRDAFHWFGEIISDLLELAALLLFGALIDPDMVAGSLGLGIGFAIVVLVVVRPATVAAVLLGTPMAPRQRIAAGWFGPKGFASVVFGILVLGSGVDGARELFGITALTVATSIVLHSSTDAPLARYFDGKAHSEPDSRRTPEDAGMGGEGRSGAGRGRDG